jgi:hypothetical protein
MDDIEGPQSPPLFALGVRAIEDRGSHQAVADLRKVTNWIRARRIEELPAKSVEILDLSQVLVARSLLAGGPVGMIPPRLEAQEPVRLQAIRLVEFVKEIRLHRDESVEHPIVAGDPRGGDQDGQEDRDCERADTAGGHGQGRRQRSPGEAEHGPGQRSESSECPPAGGRCEARASAP